MDRNSNPNDNNTSDEVVTSPRSLQPSKLLTGSDYNDLKSQIDDLKLKISNSVIDDNAQTKEQKERKSSYRISFWLTILVIVFWFIIMCQIIFNIGCIVSQPYGWHILLYSLSLIFVAFSLSARLFKRFYPNNEKNKDEELNLNTAIAKMLDKFPDILEKFIKK